MVSVTLLCSICFAQEKTKKSASSEIIPLPPVMGGGLSSLWYHDHKFIKEEYGDFELLHYKNAGFKDRQDSLTALSWTLFTMGDFLTKEVSYATLARVKGKDQGILLLMFKWHDPKDTSRTHGIFYRTFIGKDKLLLRTKQCTTGGVDTLEISCGDLQRRCGQCYYDPKQSKMVLDIIEKE
jgi:hypothetical protein